MKLEICYRILSIFLPLMWITLVSSSSISVTVGTQGEDVTNSDGLLSAFPENSKLNSLVKIKSAWKKNNKKPFYSQKTSLHKNKQLKTSYEHVNQVESKDFQLKTTNPTMTKGNYSVPLVNINKTREILTCANDDPEMQQVCENFCTQVKQFNLGFCSSDQQTCVCAMEGDDMTTLRVKLYKPKHQQKQNPLTEQSLTMKSSPEELASQEDFECDHSEYAEKVCSAYCYQFKQLNHSKCSENGKSCLCYSTETQLNQTETTDIKDDVAARSARHFMPEDEDSEIFLGMGTSASTEESDEISISVKGRSPLVPLPSTAARGCSTYSCMDVCPVFCQSMCMQSIECYCSCPEDVFYDYEDYYPLFG